MTDDTRALLETIQRQATVIHQHRGGITMVTTPTFDHDDHDAGPPLDAVTRAAAIDAGQAQRLAEANNLRAENDRLRCELADAAPRPTLGIEAMQERLIEVLQAQLATVTAERDAARGECEQVRGALPAVGDIAALAGMLPAGYARDELFAIAKRLRALPAVTAPDAGAVSDAAAAPGLLVSDDLRRQVERRGGDASDPTAYEGIASPDAAPAPAAEAEAGTGGGTAAWGTEAPTAEGVYWGVHQYDDYPSRYHVKAVIHLARTGGSWTEIIPDEEVALWGPPVPEPTPPDGWQEATDAAVRAMLPQEADHAAR